MGSINRFSGIQGWDYLFIGGTYFFFILFVALFDKMKDDPITKFYFIGLFVVFIFSFFLARSEVLRKKQLAISGIMFIDGWIKTGNDCGEECLFGVKLIKNVSEMSVNERKSFDRFIDEMSKLKSNKKILEEEENETIEELIIKPKRSLLTNGKKK